MGIWTTFFQISEQKYTKTKMVGGFEFLKMTQLLMKSSPENCNWIGKTHLKHAFCVKQCCYSCKCKCLGWVAQKNLHSLRSGDELTAVRNQTDGETELTSNNAHVCPSCAIMCNVMQCG